MPSEPAPPTTAGAPPPKTAGSREADVSHAARSGAMQVLTILAQAVMATTQVVFARLYGRTIYGAYQAVLAILDVTSRGSAAGADKAMLRYVAAFRAGGDSAGVRSAIGTGLRLCIGLASAVGLGLLLFAHPLAVVLKEEALAPALRIIAPLPILLGCLWILVQASLAARVTRANFWVRGLFEPLMLLGAGVCAWALGAGLRGLVAAQVVAAAATLVVGVLVVRRVFRPAELHRVLRAPRLPGFARFSLPLSAAELLNAVLQRADILILTAFRGADAAAVYAAAEFLSRSIANIRYAFDSIVAGIISETLHLGEIERLGYNLRLTTRWVLSAAAPIAITVIALRAELLGGLYGSAYAGGTAALVVLSLNHFASASLGLMGWVLVAAGRSRLTLLNNVLGVTFNLSMGIFLTPRYGLLGAAFSALGSTLLAQVATLIEVAVTVRVHPFSPRLLKPLAAGLVAFAAQRALHAVITPAALRVVAVIAAGVLVYGACLVLLGLPPEERRMAARAFGALRKRKPDPEIG
jgi:O-antigen/teichoic acid export membrane protein